MFLKKITGLDHFLHFLAPSERNYNLQSLSITLYYGVLYLQKQNWKSVQRCATGWLRDTVNCNFSLTDLKSAKNGLPQWFSSRKFREVLIFWCLKRARWKKFPPFRIVPKWCVFQPDLVTVLKGMVPTFFLQTVSIMLYISSVSSLWVAEDQF